MIHHMCNQNVITVHFVHTTCDINDKVVVSFCVGCGDTITVLKITQLGRKKTHYSYTYTNKQLDGICHQ